MTPLDIIVVFFVVVLFIMVLSTFMNEAMYVLFGILGLMILLLILKHIGMLSWLI